VQKHERHTGALVAIGDPGPVRSREKVQYPSPPAPLLAIPAGVYWPNLKLESIFILSF
jgi:hypothetical protein